MSQKGKKAVPALRFPEFEGDWENTTLGNISNKISSGRSKVTQEIGKYPIYGSTGIIGASEQADYSGESILIARVGANAGKISLVNGSYGVTDNTIIVKLEESSNIIFVKNQLEIKRLNSMVFGSGQPLITGTQIKKLKIVLPKTKEQQKIAQFLSACDEKLNALRRKREYLETYKRGVMQQIFTQKIRFQDDDGSDFPDWEEKKLGDVADINPSSNHFPEQFFYIDLECVNNGILGNVEWLTRDESPSRAQRVLKKGDILYQTVRPYQKNNLFFNLEGDYVASTGYAQLRAKQDRRFLYQLIYSETFVSEVLSRCTGTSYPAINSNDLGTIDVNFPTLKEQQKIAQFLTAIDHKIEAVSQQIEGMEQFKKGLLQKMFV